LMDPGRLSLVDGRPIYRRKYKTSSVVTDGSARSIPDTDPPNSRANLVPWARFLPFAQVRPAGFPADQQSVCQPSTLYFDVLCALADV